MERTITGFVVDKEYYIDMDIVWSGFTTDAASNFGMWAQGSVYNGSNWSWNYGNPMASKIGNLTSLMLSSADSFVDGAINSGRILVNSIAMDNFIEN